MSCPSSSKAPTKEQIEKIIADGIAKALAPKDQTQKDDDVIPKGAVPAYLIDRWVGALGGCACVRVRGQSGALTGPAGRAPPGPRCCRIRSSRSGRRRLASGACRCLRCGPLVKTKSSKWSRRASASVRHRKEGPCSGGPGPVSHGGGRREGLEAHGFQGHLCGAGVHAQAAQV